MCDARACLNSNIVAQLITRPPNAHTNAYKHTQAGGKNPVWNEEHAFEISSEKEAMIEIFDKENVGQDKFMGELKVTTSYET